MVLEQILYDCFFGKGQKVREEVYSSEYSLGFKFAMNTNSSVVELNNNQLEKRGYEVNVVEPAFDSFGNSLGEGSKAILVKPKLDQNPGNPLEIVLDGIYGQ